MPYSARSDCMNKLENTIKQLRSLRLAAIADQLPVLLERARDNDQSHLSLITELVEYELAQRNANRIRRNYKQARFPANKRLEQFDFNTKRPLPNGRSMSC